MRSARVGTHCGPAGCRRHCFAIEMMFAAKRLTVAIEIGCLCGAQSRDRRLRRDSAYVRRMLAGSVSG